MVLQPEQIRIIDAGLSSPGLLTEWELRFLTKLNRQRHRYVMRHVEPTDRQAAILAQIGQKPTIAHLIATTVGRDAANDPAHDRRTTAGTSAKARRQASAR